MADIGNDVFFATIPELNARLKPRSSPPKSWRGPSPARLEQLGPRYNALALALAQQALRKARAVDQDIKRERLRGPLQGIPYGVKDLLSLAGQPTTWGAKPYAGQVFDYNATVIDKLAGAGAVLAGQALHGGAGGRRRIPVCLGVAHRPGAESVGPHALVGRIFQRAGSGGGRRAGAVRHRIGNLGLHRDAGILLRRDGAAAHLRAGEPLRRHGAFLDAG